MQCLFCFWGTIYAVSIIVNAISLMKGVITVFVPYSISTIRPKICFAFGE